MATSAPPQLQQVEKTFLDALQSMDQLNKQLKASRKVAGKCKKEIKKYMVDNKIQSLDIGGKTFCFEKKQKVVVTMDRMEKAFKEEDVARYKQQNMENKTVFKMD